MSLSELLAQLQEALDAELAEVKAGARHTQAEYAAIQAAHDTMVMLGATCEGAKEEGETKAISLEERTDAVRMAIHRVIDADYMRPADTPWAYVCNVYDDYAIVQQGLISWRVAYTLTGGVVEIAPRDMWEMVEKEWEPVADGLAVKFLDDGGVKVGGYAVRFGSPDEPDLSQERDFFTKSTDFWLDRWATRPMLYHHAQEGATADEPIIGAWLKASLDDVGVWLEGELDKAHKYFSAIQEMVKRGVLAQSSDSAPHLVKRKRAAKNTHEVTRWPILASSLTPTPAEPRLLPVETIKSAYKALGIDFPDEPDGLAEPDATKSVAEGGTPQSASAELERDALMLKLRLMELQE